MRERRLLVISNYLPYTIRYANSTNDRDRISGGHSGSSFNSELSLHQASASRNSSPAGCQTLFAPSIGTGEERLVESDDFVGYAPPTKQCHLGRLAADPMAVSSPLAQLSLREEDSKMSMHPSDCCTSVSSFMIPKGERQELLSHAILDGLMGTSVSSIDSIYSDGGNNNLHHNTTPKEECLLNGQPRKWRITPYYGGNVGLFNAIKAAAASYREYLWIGLLPCDLNMPIEEMDLAIDCLRNSHQASVVRVEEGRETEGHYYRFCKHTMWPIFHNMLPDHHQLVMQNGAQRRDWEAFCRINSLFAQTIVNEYMPGDIIWVNDYHLMLVPQMVKHHLPDATVGFFLHVPFPTSEIFRCLSVRREILEGVLAADLVGFQTYSYARHFLQSCTRIMGHECSPRGIQLESHMVAIGIFPIGIDPNVLERKVRSPLVGELALRLRERYSDMRIIIARDKVDPVKGLREKLLGYQRFLEEHPEWRGRVVLIQVALAASLASSSQHPVSQLVSSINRRFGSLTYTPVIYLTQEISFSHYIALLLVSDVCLITSLRDGMNLTSHEFIYCQQANHGPLIVSEFAGTSTTFEAALRVNPWNSAAIADAIHEALEMSTEERLNRHSDLLRHVTMNTAQLWTETFLAELVSRADLAGQRRLLVAPLLDQEVLLKDYLGVNRDQRRVILLDYDVLVSSFKNIVRSLETIKRLRECLGRLCSQNMAVKNTVVLISERSQEQIEHTLAGLQHVWLCAEDGFCARMPGQDQWIDLVAEPDLSWWGKVLEIVEYYVERTPGSWIEKKRASFVWHCESADAEFSSRQIKECQAHVQDAIGSAFPIHALVGRRRLEIRLRAVGKRQAINSMLKQTLGPDVGFITLFLGAYGDDDELLCYARERIAFRLGLLATGNGSGNASETGSPSYSHSPLHRSQDLNYGRPVYLCSVGAAHIAHADCRLCSAADLVTLLDRLCLDVKKDEGEGEGEGEGDGEGDGDDRGDAIKM